MEICGLPTITLVLLKEHAQRTKPPRALFVPFPYGYALGKPGDPTFQHRVLAAALELLKAREGPVLAEFPENGGSPARLTQASALKRRNRTSDPADELTQMRGYYENWIEEHAGRTAVGNSGIPQRQFRGLVRFLEAFAAGTENGYTGVPPGVPLTQFMRRAADDLKAFMLEARMQQRPNDHNNALQEWFWGETAIGELLDRVAERLKTDGDDRTSFGIAR